MPSDEESAEVSWLPGASCFKAQVLLLDLCMCVCGVYVCMVCVVFVCVWCVWCLCVYGMCGVYVGECV